MPPVIPHGNSTYFVRTFGCQMNTHDSEHIAGVLESSGFTPAASQDEADIIIFNTCCVRQSAEDRVWGNLGRASSAGSRHKVVGVAGCMAQKHGAEIFSRAPGCNLVFGMEALARLPGLIETASESRVCDVGEARASRIDHLPSSRGASAQAWVPVSHGCNNNCSYCVVPLVRGSERSRPADEVVSEVEGLATEGVVEIVLLGQNVNSYGRDLTQGTNFAQLLRRVAGVPGMKRVKFETSHPRDLTDDILKVMETVDEVCEYLHLPVQSGSDRILEAMNRRYGRDYYIELAERARALVPGLTLTTDIIVGFPGETPGDFEDTLDLVERVRFDAAFMFLYSSREGTPAARLPGAVPDEEKHRRFDELARAQDRITAQSLEKVVGSDVEILLLGPSRSGGLLSGRTRGNRVVLVPEMAHDDPIVTVRIDSAGKHSLRGSVRG
ncbi:MAG: tRNA (N6-isopentenyl adenosine(37)-C2)-methylthiotransferase MiaB [Candidatus Geothermincolia bacterium]